MEGEIKILKSRRFGSWLCFRPQVNGGGDKNIKKLKSQHFGS
jgi:hypothetical protein